MNDEWLIYRGVGEPHDGIGALPGPPPWRDFDGGPAAEPDRHVVRHVGHRHDALDHLRLEQTHQVVAQR
ncbi:MoxR family ATPase, partial [Streptomyces goshikiensis]